MQQQSKAKKVINGMSEANFALESRQVIPALNIEYQRYRHRGTGATHIHLAAEDDNNAFMVAFPTIPSDSTGVAHILEHTTLCGSQRFPVRDPFFMMYRRSLNTFMNAFTSSDMTAYPFATCNPTDFNNLLQVYLDCVFFPNLHALDFAQEGHRLEFSDPEDPGSPLTYKGVVYNEMKGAMSAPSAQLWYHLQSHLFPTTTYHFNSGGDPAEIPDLTYEALRAFHARHYHPSNAVFMTYGDLTPEAHQAAFESYALARFGAAPADLHVPDEARLAEPLNFETVYAIGADDSASEATHICWGWLLGHAADPDEFLEAQLLNLVLLDNASSPLRAWLEATPLATAPSELCGLDDSARQVMLFAGVEGSEPQHADTLEAELLDLLGQLAEDGVAADQLTAALDQLEMSHRDVGGDGYPYGLQLLSRALPPFMYGADPLTALDIDAALARLREQAAAPGWFSGCVRRLLLENTHRVRVVMAPDAAAAAREAAREAQRLAEIAQGLDDAGRAEILAQTRALAARQAEVDDPNMLPALTLADIPAGIRVMTPERSERPKRPTSFYGRGTNGVVHQRLVFDLVDLAPADLGLLAAHNDVVSELGVGAESYQATSRARAALGDFFADVGVRQGLDGTGVRGLYTFGSKGLVRHAEGAARALYALLTEVRFDETERLRELFAYARADAEAELTERGHAYAVAAAVGQLTAAGRVHETLSGVTSLRRLKALERADDAALAAVAERLAALHERLVATPHELVMVADGAEASGLLDIHMRSGSPLPPHGTAPALAAIELPQPAAHAYRIASRVNFCARAWPCVGEAHEDAAPLAVLGGILQNGYLHTALREKGGAYGSGAVYDPGTATFRMFSYRDPRLAGTLEDFNRALEFATETRDEQMRTEAILGVIRGLDQPKSPAADAFTAWYNDRWGRDAAFRSGYREAVLTVEWTDLTRVIDHYLRPENARDGLLVGEGSLDALEALGIEAVSAQADASLIGL